ncbi:MAG: secondary thiamine-phosphate synthase enzyme YjbQ [Candidatus Thermoplasmatota archaeon]|nr:secondary thiamine-phosphate synthase enzyme YjbQ [Candidatus Thermoplasmatota archaeon]
MAVFTGEIRFKTTGEGQIIDITRRIEEIVKRSKITTGIVSSSVAGATAALTVIEFEPGLVEDFPDMLERVAPKKMEYAHHRKWDDGNGHSHVRASLIGPDLTMPVRKGEMVRGTWQHPIFLELDVRPTRDRIVHVTVIGE